MRRVAKRIVLGLAVTLGAGTYIWVAAVRAAPAIRVRKERSRASRRGER